MPPQNVEAWWEKSGWVKVDDVTYQLQEEAEAGGAAPAATPASLDFFLSLVKAALHRG